LRLKAGTLPTGEGLVGSSQAAPASWIIHRIRKLALIAAAVALSVAIPLAKAGNRNFTKQ
jgi:hypothetical protein